MIGAGAVAVTAVAAVWWMWKEWTADPLPLSTNERMRRAIVRHDKEGTDTGHCNYGPPTGRRGMK